jgi:hypothetical protein
MHGNRVSAVIQKYKVVTRDPLAVNGSELFRRDRAVKYTGV